MKNKIPVYINVKISREKINKINDILMTIKGLSFSINYLLKEILTEKINSKIMVSILKILTIEEGAKNQTYRDCGNNNNMTIAVGLDIQPPNYSDVKAVLLSVNPLGF